MMPLYDVVIVGAGHAGAQVAIALRQNGFEGSIALIGDEPEFPYERPPLSKEYFSGDKARERLLIRPSSFWAEKQINVLLGQRVLALDSVAHCVEITGGERIGYGRLVWAAGGSPRRLPLAGANAENVLAIRTLADADRLKAVAGKADHIVIIGGGYIGLEAAAVLTKAGKRVTLLEAQDRVLARASGVELSRFLERVHRDHGVDLRLGVSIKALEGDDRVTGVCLEDGERLLCDLLIVGIGILPEVAPLADAGARIGNGVLVDDHCATSLPDIYAVGDLAAHASRFADGAVIRLESVQNAADMANTVAKNIVGVDTVYASVPWFWSNQYDLKIQTVGLSMGYDQTVLRGSADNGAFSIVYLKQGRVIALDCVNTPKDYVQGKSLVLGRARIAPDILEDGMVNLKQMEWNAVPADG